MAGCLANGSHSPDELRICFWVASKPNIARASSKACPGNELSSSSTSNPRSGGALANNRLANPSAAEKGFSSRSAACFITRKNMGHASTLLRCRRAARAS